jgi:1,4-dihydroxy-2-naphthoate octaprenyltransferase
MSTIKSYSGVARAPFLLLPVTLVASGAAAAAYDGAFSWPNTLIALAGLISLHIAVNSLNEASDMQSGIDLHTERTPFSGGSGTLPSGRLTIRQASAFGWSAAAFGAAIGLWFLVRIGWPFVPVLVFGAIAVITYTNLLARAGLGEFFAGLGLGALPVIGTALVQNGELSDTAVAAAVPAFLMTFNLLLLNEFPDEAADRQGGRKNLVILLGRQRAARLYALLAIATPLSIATAIALGVFPAAAIIGAFPFAMAAGAVRWALGESSEPVPVSALGGNVIWNLATNSFLAGGLLLATWRGW